MKRKYKRRYIVLPIIGVLAIGTLAIIQTGDSPEVAGLIGEVIITRPLQGGDKLGSSDDRIKIAPEETAVVDLKLNQGQGKIRIEAPNGGLINRDRANLEVDPMPVEQSLRFDFTPGRDPGRYTIEVSQGNSKETLEFWVGEESPVGKSGPNLRFTGTR
jgi:hypothetical protein